jgi:hypothetical protein
MRRATQDGQALVELVALLPAMVLIGLIGWQIAAAGYAWTLAGGAARAGSRAAEVGAPAREAALAALPGRYGRGAEVRDAGDGDGHGVRVRLRVPWVLPFLPGPRHVASEAPAPP